MSAIGNIGQQGAQEFFETFTYLFAYDQSKDFVKEYFPKDPNGNPYLEEAKESAIQLATMAGIFQIIQYQEVLLEKAFTFVKAVIIALMGLAAKGINKLKTTGKTGRIWKWMSEFIGNSVGEAIERAKLILQWLGLQIDAGKSSYQSGQLVRATQNNRQNVVERDRSAMMMGKGLSENYINSLMFKLFTSSFTANDETMIKRILGRDTATELNVDDMNKIGSFMFTKDINGKLTGLTEQFYSLLVGQGIFKKTPAPV